MTEENENLLLPSAQYLKSGIHIGTKFKTGYMKEFIYKTRPDGLSVLNLQKTDERIRECAKILAEYEPEDILILSRRENGWLPVKMLNKFTGIKVIAGRYPPGMLTNPELEIFSEPKKYDFNRMYLDQVRYFLNCLKRKEKTFNDVSSAVKTLTVALKAKNKGFCIKNYPDSSRDFAE